MAALCPVWEESRASEGGREGAEERGRRITLTQITNQPWCRKEEMSPWQRKPPASVMWNWRWCLSRRRAHTAHLHAERPVPHHVAARWVLTAIPSHGGEMWGLSQTQLWHRRLSRSQTWTHTEAQYGCCSSSQTNSHRVKKWFFSGFCSAWWTPAFISFLFLSDSSHWRCDRFESCNVWHISYRDCLKSMSMQNVLLNFWLFHMRDFWFSKRSGKPGLVGAGDVSCFQAPVEIQKLCCQSKRNKPRTLEAVLTLIWKNTGRFLELNGGKFVRLTAEKSVYRWFFFMFQSRLLN